MGQSLYEVAPAQVLANAFTVNCATPARIRQTDRQAYAHVCVRACVRMRTGTHGCRAGTPKWTELAANVDRVTDRCGSSQRPLWTESADPCGPIQAGIELWHMPHDHAHTRARLGFLGDYVEGLDAKKLNVDVWKGASTY